MPALIDAARSVAPLAAELAGQAERERRLPGPVSDALRDAGIYRMLVPSSLGGGEAEPAEMIEVLETLGRADGAAGWCAMVSATAGMVLARMAPEAAGEVFPTPETVLAGVFAPHGRAERRGDRLLVVNGHWSFGSNIENSDWVFAGCRIEGQGPVLLALRREQVRLIDTWRVSGLRGTGSHDFEVDGLSVPVQLAADPEAVHPSQGGALYSFPLIGTLALGIASVALGIATAAIDELVEVAGAKVPSGSRRRLADREVVQAALARARGEVRAGRALMLEEARDAWSEALAGEISLQRRASLRLAATHAMSASVSATGEIFSHAGGSAIYETSALQRRLRDVHVAAQHMMVAPPTYELIGRVELGLEVEGRGL